MAEWLQLATRPSVMHGRGPMVEDDRAGSPKARNRVSSRPDALAATIRGAQRGDAASLDRLVDEFAGRIYGFLYRMTGSRADAEDLMQEVFVRLVRTIRSYEHDGRFEAWLF